MPSIQKPWITRGITAKVNCYQATQGIFLHVSGRHSGFFFQPSSSFVYSSCIALSLSRCCKLESNDNRPEVIFIRNTTGRCNITRTNVVLKGPRVVLIIVSPAALIFRQLVIGARVNYIPSAVLSLSLSRFVRRRNW